MHADWVCGMSEVGVRSITFSPCACKHVRRSSWLWHASLCSTVWIYCGEEGGCNNGYGEVAPYQSCGLRHQDIPAVSGAYR